MANLCGPSVSRSIPQRLPPHVRCFPSQKGAQECHVLTLIVSGVTVRIAQGTGQELMARVPHAAQIDLRFGDPAREFLDFSGGLCPGNLVRERCHLFGQGWIATNGQAQPVAEGVSRRASPALRGLRAGAGPRIRAVGLDLAVARQAPSSPLAGVVSITSNSPSSISSTLRRSLSPRTARRRSISRRLALRRFSAMAAR